jgi:flavin-dependent dehydrogenase
MNSILRFGRRIGAGNVIIILVSFGWVFGNTLNAQQAESRDVVHADVCVYGGTPGGITAAISAAREGASVVLLEQTKHVGGLSTSGLNRDEGEHMDRSTFGGLSDRFTIEAARRSGTDTENAEGARIWQSHIAEQVFLDMLKEAGVSIRYEQFLEKVEKTGARISKLQVREGTVYEAKGLKGTENQRFERTVD